MCPLSLLLTSFPLLSLKCLFLVRISEEEIDGQQWGHAWRKQEVSAEKRNTQLKLMASGPEKVSDRFSNTLIRSKDGESYCKEREKSKRRVIWLFTYILNLQFLYNIYCKTLVEVLIL